MKLRLNFLFIGITLLLTGSIGCDNGPTVFENKDGRTISWDGGAITLNNKNTSANPEKKFVVLENIGSKPSSNSPLIFQDVTLNQISNKVHVCGGSIEVTENKIEIGANGSSDRCEMFNGTWYVQGEVLANAAEKGFVPEAFHGKFSNGSAAITVNKNIISGTFPEAFSENDQSVEFTLTKGDQMSSSTTIAGKLNMINGNLKSCSGTIKESNGSVVIELTGNSSRCSSLSGNWK